MRGMLDYMSYRIAKLLYNLIGCFRDAILDLQVLPPLLSYICRGYMYFLIKIILVVQELRTVFSHLLNGKTMHRTPMYSCLAACTATSVYHVVPFVPLMGPLALKFDRSTLPSLKIDMPHEAYRHGKNISDMTWDIS